MLEMRQGAVTPFADPYRTIASMSMPRSVPNALRLAELIWYYEGGYKEAMRKMSRFHITDLDYGDFPNAQASELHRFLINDMDVMTQLGACADDWSGYGNSFSSLVLPFNRFLRCMSCGTQRLLINASFRFDINTLRFQSHCSSCQRVTDHDHIDRKSCDTKRVSVRRWSVHQIRIRQHEHNHAEKDYFWDIPPRSAKKIREGDPFELAHMPWEVVETIRLGQLFQFSRGVVTHIFEPTLCGVDSGGWGLPRALASFHQAFYVRLLKRVNEVLASDYMVPIRTFSPPAGAVSRAGNDPLMAVHGMNMPDFVGAVRSMLREWRLDPGATHITPVPLEYRVNGGEGKSMAPDALIGQGLGEFLDSVGVPPNVQSMNFPNNSAAPALRLFEALTSHIPNAFNRLLDIWVDGSCSYFGWRRPDSVRMRPARHADDMELRGVMLQLASSDIISRQTALGPIGVDVLNEMKRILREKYDQAEASQKYEEDARQRAELTARMSGAGQPGAPMGGPAGAGAGSGSSSLEGLQAEAQQIADQWSRMDAPQRRAAMVQLKRDAPAIHAVANAKWKDMQQGMETEGKHQILASQRGQ